MRKIWLTVQLILAILTVCSQQPGKLTLENQRAVIQKEIDDVKRSLDETRRNKKISLEQLSAIQKKLLLRQMEINVINQQMDFIARNIDIGKRDVANLTKQLDTMRRQYEKSVVYSYKSRRNFDLLNFIFSANSFNQALKMIFYLKVYGSYRQNQINSIAHTQDLIHGKIATLDHNRLHKELLLKEADKAQEKLEEDKKEKDEVVKKLNAKEKALIAYIAGKKALDSKLKVAILNAINRTKAVANADVKKSREVLIGKSDVLKGKVYRPAATEDKVKGTAFKPANTSNALSMATITFEQSQHHFPWPIESGTIVMHFGPQQLPGKAEVIYDNKFLTLEAPAGSPVKAIFGGDIVLIAHISDVQAIVVKYGKYYITYGNLSSVNVTMGQRVEAGQTMGKLAEKVDNKGELELGISNDANKNFDPEKWLRPNR